MIYMGSKLVLGNKQEDEALSRKQILKTLSVQEKLLLTELQKTRENIVDELKRVEFGQGFADSHSIQSTIEDYEYKISGIENTNSLKAGSRGGSFPALIAGGSTVRNQSSALSTSQSLTSLGAAGKKKGVGNNKRSIMTGIDMLPSLETFSVKSGTGSKMMSIRLPIFKLPNVEMKMLDPDLDHIQHSTINTSSPSSKHVGIAEHKTSGGTNGGKALAPTDRHTKGGTKMRVWHELEFMAQTAPKDLKQLMQYLKITVDDFNILKAKFMNFVKGIDNSASTKSTYLTIVAKYDTLKHSVSTNVTLASSGDGSGQAHKHSSHGDRGNSDEHSLASSRNSLGSISSSSIVARSMSFDGTMTSGSKSHGRSQKGKASSKMQKSDDLRNELISSMKAMEFHSSKLKEGFANLNGVISISDPKLKLLRFSIAAERMRKVLWGMIRFDMLKGFEAWKLAILYISNETKSVYFSRCLFIKSLLKTLFRIALSLIKRKWHHWHKFARFESRRLRKELELHMAIFIQRVIRGHIARKRVAILMQNSKYQKMYDATIKIQSVIRSKVVRWKYMKFLKARARDQAARKIQRVARGKLGRIYFKVCWLIKNKNKCIIKIQAAARRRLARKRVAKIKIARIKIKAAVKIQGLMRGFLIRLNIKKILEQKAQVDAASLIQRIMRGKLARIRVGRKRVSLAAAIRHRNLCANLIQAVYRGYSSRVVTKIMLMEKKRVFRMKYDAATMINKTVRGFIGSRRVQKLFREKDKKMNADARLFKEIWNNDSKAYFYLNESTGEALWEPPKAGYTKADGNLVLANGKIVEDNRFKIRKDEDDEEDVKKNSNLCSECTERIAIVSCNECGDKYCTKCYKSLHAVGSRRNHVTVKLGPVDCTECEMRLAERFCVSCDEPFCDQCWRKLHGRGKRRFHPFQEVSPQGYIDSRILTMDGEEVTNYDLTYSQLKDESQTGNGDEANWVEAYDDDGNQYWYDEVSGQTTYDDPFASAWQEAGEGYGGEGGDEYGY